MLAHGERDYPFECCGLVLGQLQNDGRKTVIEIHPISNAREEEAKRMWERYRLLEERRGT